MIEDKYIKLLNRGGLLIPSSNVCFYSSKCFAILDVIFDVLFKYLPNDIRNCGEYFLDRYLPPIVPLTIHPAVRGFAELFPIYVYTYIYINNNQNISNSEIRKDDVRRLRRVKLRREKCYKHSNLRRDDGFTCRAKWKTFYMETDGSVPVPFNFSSHFLQVFKNGYFYSHASEKQYFGSFPCFVYFFAYIYFITF